MKQSTLNRYINISYAISIMGIICKVLRLEFGFIVMLLGFLMVGISYIIPTFIKVIDDSETYEDRRSEKTKYIEFGIYVIIGTCFEIGMSFVRTEEMMVKPFMLFILVMALYWFISYRGD